LEGKARKIRGYNRKERCHLTQAYSYKKSQYLKGMLK
jgi:hypothetical protein